MVPEVPPRSPAPRSRGCLGFLVVLVALAGVAMVVLMSVSFDSLFFTADDGLEEKYHSLNKRGDDKVATESPRVPRRAPERSST